MKYNKIPKDTFKEIQLNAGILLNTFDPETATTTDEAMIGATSGGVSFSATPTMKDYGEDIDNCPKNTKELKKIDMWDVHMTGSFVQVNADLVKKLVGAADSALNKVTPRNDIDSAKDFSDIWWVGDYSDENGETNGGYIAIHLMNALSVGGFQIQATDREKGKFAFDFQGHYSMAEQDKVPFEVYVKAGSPEI